MNALSFDLEDWFHMIGIDGLETPAVWPALPSIFERYTRLILDDLDEFGARATFFTLGWIAERYPELLCEIAARGHEIGSHSHMHRTVYSLGRSAFSEDLERSVNAIRIACGQAPRGFRAPSFSIIPGCEWAFDVLLDAGFEYDASLFPAARAHGGYPCPPGPHRQTAPSGRTLLELPMSTMSFLGWRTAFSGGGFMRLFPLRVSCAGFAQSHAENRPVVVYLHPRDFAADCPSPPMPLHRRFKSRIGQRTTRKKLRFLLETYTFGPCRTVLNAWDLK